MMARKMWVKDPHSGGKKVPQAVQTRVRERIVKHAQEQYSDRGYTRIDVRFRGKFCYIDAYKEPVVADGWPPEDWGETREEFIERLRNTPTHLCRLRYFGDEEKWSLAFYTYSNEKYEPCLFRHNDWYGTPEQAFDVGSVYLD
ncbi:MAG: hypothetical protein AAFX99_11055 [Myxococcota bacterium]